MKLEFTLWEPVQKIPVIRVHAGHPFMVADRIDEAHQPDDVFVKINYEHDDDYQLIWNLREGRPKRAPSLLEVMPGTFKVDRTIRASLELPR